MSAQPRGPGRLVAWFRENLAFRPEDRRSALLVVVLHAIVGSALVVAFTARDAIFLSTTPDKLPLAYLVAAVASGFAAAGVSSLRRRLPAELLLPIASTLAGSILFALGLLAWKKGDAAAGRFIFMLVDAIAAAVIVPTWSLTESTFSARDTGRVISLVNAGRLIVVLVAGLWTYAIVQVLAPCWLLVVAAVLLWLSSIPVILLGLRRALRGVPVRVTLPPGEVLAARLRTLAMPHVSLLAVVMVLGVIVATLVDFQFKTAVAAKFPGDAAGIARFASGYASFSGGLALVLTLAAAPFLYARYGVGGVLVGCAVATAAGMGSIFFGLPVLIAAGISKSTHELFRFSGADSTLPTFLAPLPRQLRDDVGGFIRSYVIPFASIGAAVLIVGTERWRLAVPAATVVGAALLVVALNRFRTEFTRSRRYGAARVVTDDGASFVPAALLSPDRREVETALELAPRIRVDFTASVVPLIVHPEPRIRRLALDYLASRPTPETKNPELSDRVRQCLGDAEPDVRVSAIQALCVLERAGALGDLLGFLNAPESRVRAAAAAALFFHGGSTGQAAGARPLMRLLGSSDPAEREAIAESLAAIALEACTQPVLALVEDEDPRVRRAAVKAAGRIRSAQLLPVLVDALAKNDTAHAAREALAGYGERVLGRLLVDQASHRAVVVETARILGRLGTDEAILVLMDHLDDHDEIMRGAIVGALSRAATRHPNLRVDRGRLEGALIVEAAAAYRALAMTDAFVGADGKRRDRAAALIGWAVGEKYERAIGRLLRIVQALHPHAVVSRATAAEVLPNLLAGAAKDAAMPLFESSTALQKLAQAQGVLRPPRQNVEAWIRELLSDGDRWVLCAAAHYAGVRRIAGVSEKLEALLERKDRVIRETALQALERILPVQKLPLAVKRVLWDEDDKIKRSVDRLLERILDQVEFDRAEGAAQEAFR